jgi:hypothetical protein
VNKEWVYRAVAGMLLRAHFATSHLFKQVSLSKLELRELRQAIRSGDYPPDRFALFASKWVNTSVEVANPRSVLFVNYERARIRRSVSRHHHGRHVLDSFPGSGASLVAGCIGGRKRGSVIFSCPMAWTGLPTLSSGPAQRKRCERKGHGSG